MAVDSERVPFDPVVRAEPGGEPIPAEPVVIELIPGEHYLVLFDKPGDAPAEETVEELRILAYARRGHDTLGPGWDGAVATLAQAVSTGSVTGPLWAQCQAAAKYVLNRKARAEQLPVMPPDRAVAMALEALTSAEATIPVPVAYSKVDIAAPDGSFHITVRTQGTPIEVHVDTAGQVVDVIIGAPGANGPQTQPATGEAEQRPRQWLGADSPSAIDRDVRPSRDPCGHVFVSYVQEDSAEVDQLCQILGAAGIPTWRDTANLWPGEDWRVKIRQEITANALVFLACFSRRSLNKAKSFHNEELTLAVEELRLRQPDQPWLIPIRFDDCEVPDRRIDSDRSLAYLHPVDLFGEHYLDNANRLTEAIKRILGLGG